MFIFVLRVNTAIVKVSRTDLAVKKHSECNESLHCRPIIHVLVILIQITHLSERADTWTDDLLPSDNRDFGFLCSHRLPIRVKIIKSRHHVH